MSAINGAALFKSRCSFCHTVEPNGDNKSGPNVFGIVNRKAAQKKYAYSSALKKANVTWTPEALDKYLENSTVRIKGDNDHGNWQELRTT
ncbi:cytochrome c-like domain-containing protein [Dissophora ornata]|nr:cytochrome c-like domain-containing protein [Dissophora ornata]